MTATFDLDQSRKERDEALSRVARREFMTRGLLAIACLPFDIYTGEDVRRKLTERGITPHHHNAWGSLIRTAVRQGLLIDTGSVQQMTDKRSHARRTTAYKVSGA